MTKTETAARAVRLKESSPDSILDFETGKIFSGNLDRLESVRDPCVPGTLAEIQGDIRIARDQGASDVSVSVFEIKRVVVKMSVVRPSFAKKASPFPVGGFRGASADDVATAFSIEIADHEDPSSFLHEDGLEFLRVGSQVRDLQKFSKGDPLEAAYVADSSNIGSSDFRKIADVALETATERIGRRKISNGVLADSDSVQDIFAGRPIRIPQNPSRVRLLFRRLQRERAERKQVGGETPKGSLPRSRGAEDSRGRGRPALFRRCRMRERTEKTKSGDGNEAEASEKSHEISLVT